MRRNMTGLKRSARLRSEQAMERILAALHRMDTADREINFRTVAAEAKVSTAWLYGQKELRIRITRSRRTTSHRVVPSASASQDRERYPGRISWRRYACGSTHLRRRTAN